MDLGVFEKICKELQGRCQCIDLHILGDPLKNKFLLDYLKLAEQYSHQVEIVTSGFYLNQWDFSILLSPPIRQLNISLSAYTDQNNPKKQDYLKACLDLAHFHQSNALKCFVNLRMHKSRLDLELAQIICQEFGIKDSFQNDRIKLGEYLFLTLSRDFDWINSSSPNLQKKKFCHGLSTQIGFLSDGVVIPCCIDCEGQINLGNIKEQSLQSILSSSLSQKILNGFQRGEAYHLQCQRCTYPAQK